jgi:hypothetical protein
MVEKEISQLKMAKICLITNYIDIFVLQKFIPVKPEAFAAGTFFKNFHCLNCILSFVYADKLATLIWRFFELV